MKTKIFIVALLAAFSSCKKEDNNKKENQTYGTFRLMFQHQGLDLSGSGLDIQLDSLGYKTPEGDTISYDHLKYYVSNLVLVNDENEEIEVPDSYYLITQDDNHTAAMYMVDVPDIPVDTYIGIKFAVGVDENCNTVSPCEVGDLDPFNSNSTNMIWNWALPNGYKFLRIEGDFKGDNTSGSGAVDGTYSLHVGGNTNYREFEFSPGDDIVIEEDKTTMTHFMVMTQQIFTDPNTIDLEAGSDQGTIGATNIANNYSTEGSTTGMFMLHHVGSPMM